MSTVEKSLDTIFGRLELPHATGYNRRILAVLRYLESCRERERGAPPSGGPSAGRTAELAAHRNK